MNPEPAAGGVLALPLVLPQGMTEGDSKVRIWSEPGQLPAARGRGGRSSPRLHSNTDSW